MVSCSFLGLLLDSIVSTLVMSVQMDYVTLQRGMCCFKLILRYSVPACAALRNSLHDPLLHQISSRHSDQQNTGTEHKRDKEHRLICSPCCSLSATWGKKKTPLYLLFQLFPLPTSSRGWPWETCHQSFPLCFHLPAIFILVLALLQGMAQAQHCFSLPCSAAKEPVQAGIFWLKTCLVKLKKEGEKSHLLRCL